jgi:hypothetical protein
MGWRDALDTGPGVSCKQGVLQLGRWWVGGSEGPSAAVVVVDQQAARINRSMLSKLRLRIQQQQQRLTVAQAFPCQLGVVLMVWVCTVGVGDGGVPLSSQLCSSFVDSTVSSGNSSGSLQGCGQQGDEGCRWVSRLQDCVLLWQLP